MSSVQNISRRDFVRTSGVAGSALALGVHVSWPDSLLGFPSDAPTFEPNLWVSIGDDGIVRLTVHRSEMGQGARTTCCMLLAEELDVSLDGIEIVQAIGDPRYGDQHTAGSTTVLLNWEPLRHAGAAARAMLVSAAASVWDLPDAEGCTTEDGHVFHAASGRRLSYKDLVATAVLLPVPENVRLKSPDEFRIIGKSRAPLDIQDIVQGKAVFGWDVNLPDMLYSSVERSPMVKGTIRRYDAEAARAVRDVVDVVELEANTTGLTNNSIAVVARNTWAAIKGREALNVEWDRGSLPAETSDEYRAKLETLGVRPGRVIRSEGDFDAAAAAADRVIEAQYHGPYLVHAPLEPPTCTARVDGNRCEVWTPTQAPQWTRAEVAGALGLSQGNVTVNVTLLGGGFGRKSKPDYAVEAAVLSKKLGKPVKVAWTREDEIRHGFYRAQNFQLLQATVDAEGNPTGWLHRSVFPAIGWAFNPDGLYPGQDELGQGLLNMPYRFPNLRVEAGRVASSVRIGWMRSVCNQFHAFAVNSFMDELAHELGRDPVAFHLEMLGQPRILEFSERDRESPYAFDTGRLARVAEAAAQMSRWGRPLPDRHGLGFAVHYSFRSYVGMVAHISVDQAGDVKVHAVSCAVDCGTVVNPDGLQAQMEGAVAMGLSLAKYGRITVRDGIVEQGNFDDYPIVRMSEMPKVSVRILEGGGLPTGIGEPGVPPTAPAVCNAIFAATGVRIRDLPLTGHDLSR